MKHFKAIYIVTLVLVFLLAGKAYAEDLPAYQGAPDANATLFPTTGASNSGSLLPSGAGSAPTNEQISAELGTSIEQTAVQQNSQAVAYDSRNQTSESTEGGGFQAAAVDAIGCSAGQILGNMLSSLISSAITTVIGEAVSTVADVTNVPVSEKGQALLNSNSQAYARVGTTVGFMGIGTLVEPSWDAIGYCIVNAMINYVANSTIAWVQGGFKGNPSFITNPEQFFKDLANVEAGAFLQDLAYGATGLNICQPFRAQIVLSIARNYVSSYQGYGGVNGYSRGGFGGAGGNVGYGGCTLDDIKGNLEGFLNGNFGNNGWQNWFQISQVDSNNPYSTYLSLQARLDGAISKKQNLARLELDWGKGFFSMRKCDDSVSASDQQNCPITSPGTVIQGQLEKTLGLPKDRLVLAEKFDQVIAAVVNELITVALDKVLESNAE